MTAPCATPAASASPLRAWVGLWLGALLVILQIGGVHVHLCLDGFEPHQTLHWGDADLRDSQLHGAASHRDRDVCVQPQVLLRASHVPVLLPQPLIALFLSRWVPAPVRLARPAFRRSRAPPRHAYRLSPPAQAPPF